MLWRLAHRVRPVPVCLFFGVGFFFAVLFRVLFFVLLLLFFNLSADRT